MKIGPFYGELRTSGLDFGARFANVRELWLGKPGSGEAFSRVALSSGATENDPYRNLILLDSCQHAIGAAITLVGEKNRAGAVVPASIQSIRMRSLLPSEAWSHVRLNVNGDGRAIFASIRVLGDDGEVLVEMENLELRRMTSLSNDKDAGASAKSNGSSSASQLFTSRDELIGLLRPMSHKERVSLISKWLTVEIKDTMGQAAEGLSLDRLPPSTAFLEIGLDSLLVTELQRRIQEKLLFRFKPMQGLDYQSIESLAEYILSEVLLVELQVEAAAAD
jgi:acyl carrier protein